MVIIIYGVCGFHCSLMPSVCSPQFLPQLSGCSPAWLPPCAVKQLGRTWPDFVVILLHCQGFCSALFSLACCYLLLASPALSLQESLVWWSFAEFCFASPWESWEGKTGPSREGRLKAALSSWMLRVQAVQQGGCIPWPLKKKPSLKIACQSLEGYDEIHLKKWSLESLSFCKWR